MLDASGSKPIQKDASQEQVGKKGKAGTLEARAEEAEGAEARHGERGDRERGDRERDHAQAEAQRAELLRQAIDGVADARAELWLRLRPQLERAADAATSSVGVDAGTAHWIREEAMSRVSLLYLTLLERQPKLGLGEERLAMRALETFAALLERRVHEACELLAQRMARKQELDAEAHRRVLLRSAELASSTDALELREAFELRLWSILRSLRPRRMRSRDILIWRMRVDEGLSFEEIAERLRSTPTGAGLGFEGVRKAYRRMQNEIEERLEEIERLEA